MASWRSDRNRIARHRVGHPVPPGAPPGTRPTVEEAELDIRFPQSTGRMLNVDIGFTHPYTRDVAEVRRRAREPGRAAAAYVYHKHARYRPLLSIIYSFIYAHGVSIDAWELVIVASVKKNCLSLTDMSNMRGVHVLQFFRQLYVSLLLSEVDELSRRVALDAQQGFVGGRLHWGFILGIACVG